MISPRKSQHSKNKRRSLSISSHRSFSSIKRGRTQRKRSIISTPKSSPSSKGKTLRVQGRTFTYYKSSRPGKKLMVEVDGKTIHFGDANMQHYKDRTGIWSSKNHLDSRRRENYIKRHTGGEGSKINNPNQAAFHARYVLW